MLLQRFGTFSGGIDLPDDKAEALGLRIAPPEALMSLRVPLAPADAQPARLEIEVGQYVSHGERLARADGPGQVDVFAPLAGRLAGVTEVKLPRHPYGWRACPAVELVELDPPVGVMALPAHYNWRGADEAPLRERVAEGGLVTCRGRATPLAAWIDAAKNARVDTLIANVMENTPHGAADHRLLAEFGMDVIRGLAILAKCIGADDVLLAVDHRRTGDYRDAVGPAKFYRIQSIALDRKYPIGNDTVLVKVLTRREVPLGGATLDVGVAVTDAATCWATFRWVACGENPTARAVAVAGTRVANAANYFLPYGADLAEVLAMAGVDGDGPVVVGSAMTGREAPEGAVVGPQTDELLALAEPQGHLPTPCIRCGWCSDNCPARLNVAALNDDFELARAGRAQRRGAEACVDCGICTYVCPARLPLAERVRRLNQAIRQDRLAASAGAQEASARP